MKKKSRDQETAATRATDCSDMMRSMMKRFCHREEDTGRAVISSMMTKCRSMAARFCDERSPDEQSST